MKEVQIDHDGRFVLYSWHCINKIIFFHDSVSKWLRRWTRNPLGSARRGSNPLAVAFVPSKGFFFIVLALALHAFFSFLCVIFLTPCLSPSRSISLYILPSLSPHSASLHHLSFCFTSLPYRILFVYYCMRVHVSPVSHTGTARVA